MRSIIFFIYYTYKDCQAYAKSINLNTWICKAVFVTQRVGSAFLRADGEIYLNYFLEPDDFNTHTHNRDKYKPGDTIDARYE